MTMERSFTVVSIKKEKRTVHGLDLIQTELLGPIGQELIEMVCV